MEKKKRGRPPKEGKVEEKFFEKTRTYFFPVTNTHTGDITVAPIEIKNITEVNQTTGGNHKIKTKDLVYIIPKGWIAIEIKV